MARTVASEIVVGENGRVNEIKFLQYKSDIGPQTGSGSVRAKIYVIAANPIEAARLLLMSTNSGRTKKGVANSSDMVASGMRHTIPATMSRLMPLPTPYSSICSPIHIKNTVPVVMIMMVVIVKKKVS